MHDYGEFARQVDAQIKEWQRQATDLQNRMMSATGDPKAQYEVQLRAMQDTIQKATKFYADLQKSNQAAWGDIQEGAAKSFKEWQDAWTRAMSRYK